MAAGRSGSEGVGRTGRRKKPPAFPVYPSDALSDELYLALSVVGEGAFWRLLLIAWMSDGLPPDARAVHVLCRCTEEEWSEVGAQVLELFPEASDGRRRNPRQERERAAYRGFCASRADAARSRWEKEGDARAMQVQCTGYASAMPPTPTPTPTPKKKNPPPGGAGGPSSPSPAEAGSPRGSGKARGKKPKPAEPGPGELLERWLVGHGSLDTPRFREAWLGYEDHRAQGPKRTRMTPRARALAFGKLEGLGPEEAAAVVERSVMNGWQGIFPERLNGKGDAPKEREITRDEQLKNEEHRREYEAKQERLRKYAEEA